MTDELKRDAEEEANKIAMKVVTADFKKIPFLEVESYFVKTLLSFHAKHQVTHPSAEKDQYGECWKADGAKWAKEIHTLEARVKELTDKGENLCEAHGMTLIKVYDLKALLAEMVFGEMRKRRGNLVM